jgi:hypothetical protein
MLKRLILSIALIASGTSISSPANASSIKYGDEGDRYICASNSWVIRDSGGQSIGKQLKAGKCMELTGITENGAFLKVRGASGRSLTLKVSPSDLELYNTLAIKPVSSAQRKIAVCELQESHLKMIGRGLDLTCVSSHVQDDVYSAWLMAYRQGQFKQRQLDELEAYLSD